MLAQLELKHIYFHVTANLPIEHNSNLQTTTDNHLLQLKLHFFLSLSGFILYFSYLIWPWVVFIHTRCR